MKKLSNSPNDYAGETLESMCLAFPGYYKRAGETGRVIMRPNSVESGKVGIVTGGGSEHLPVFVGYCGPGLVDACAVGNVFAGPSVPDCIDTIKAADGGVLRL